MTCRARKVTSHSEPASPGTTSRGSGYAIVTFAAASVAKFEAAIRPGRTECYLELGNSLWEIDDKTVALSAFEKAVAEGDTSAYRNAGMLAEELGQFGRAVEILLQAFDSGDRKALAGAAMIEKFDQDRVVEGETHMQRAADLGDPCARSVQASSIWPSPRIWIWKAA